MGLKVTILDYQCGNIFNLFNAIKKIGFSPIIATRKREIKKADVLILGGVGAFEFGIKKIKTCGFDEKLNEFYQLNKKIIGICLGAQLLLTKGEEFKLTNGLNFLDGNCISLNGISEKVPSTGWHPLKISKKSSFKEFNKKYFYFNHSFYMKIKNIKTIQNFYLYDKKPICGSFEFNNLIGFQFHPEKSGIHGLQILKKAILI